MNDLLWLLYLSLYVVLVNPIYATCSFSKDTVALYMMQLERQFPSIGQLVAVYNYMSFYLNQWCFIHVLFLHYELWCFAAYFLCTHSWFLRCFCWIIYKIYFLVGRIFSKACKILFLYLLKLGCWMADNNRGLVVIASALEKPGTWVRIPASVIFLFVQLRPFFLAALAKRWKVQFRQG